MPRRFYKRIENRRCIYEICLIHATETKENRSLITGKLKEECVVKQTNHLKDYSNNAFGLFRVEDIYWWVVPTSPQKDYYIEPWGKSDNIAMPNVPQDFEYNSSRGFFVLEARDFCEKEIQFQDWTRANPVCKVIHTPTKANFWHFSIRWYFEGKDLESWTEGIKKRMKSTAKTYIIEKAKFEIPPYRGIKSKYYVS